MNGRMYDPVLGRFLSPDPFVADPFNTQDFNRYSYVVNNPLKYIDPSGYLKVAEFWKIVQDLLNSSDGGEWTPEEGGIHYYSSGEAANKTASLGGGTVVQSSRWAPYKNPYAWRQKLNGIFKQYTKYGLFDNTGGQYYVVKFNTDPFNPNTYEDDSNGYSEPVNLLTSNSPIEDIFSRINYLNNRGSLNHLNDIILSNGYGKNTPVGPYYHKRIKLSGYTYDLRISPYNPLNPERYYYDIFDMGFDHLDRWYNDKSENFNDGYEWGFWLTGYENNPLILIGANNVNAYNYLRKIFHSINP